MSKHPSDRTLALANRLGEAGIDAYLAWDPITMGYMEGFFEGSHERFLTLAISAKGDVQLICPSLSAAQARRGGIVNIDSWADGEDPLALFADLAVKWDLKSGIIAVDATMPSRMLLQLQSVLPAALFKNGEELVSAGMGRKDADEIDKLHRSGRIADDTYIEVLPQIKAGMTENELGRLLKDGMSNRGGKPTFCIVAAGRNGAEPHHLTDDTVLERGDVVIIDFGCELEGYQSDITRTVAIGEASDEAKKVYDIVYRAHMAARAAIRPGVSGEAIDNGARDVIVAAGYGPQFYHRTGHGIGMNGHEHPNMVAGNVTPLVAGNCFSIEPGIYLEGNFGVRIENIVACTESGHMSMNDEPASELYVTPR
ncbi:Xaa-Pro peptidase family protein [soil metagenome]